MKTNPEEITKALKAFFSPGDVFEIRVLEAITAKGASGYSSRPHIESGYFDYSHIGNVASALEHIRSARGVYVTPNPVNPDLLARCANRIQSAMQDSTTKDKNILRRRWLLVDCDVEHNGVSGISSSDGEHCDAELKAREIAEKLSGIGWPEPIVMDSGNGASLMYAVDLDVGDGDNALVGSIIDAFKSFDSETVKVDPQVKNLARVWRLPGTMNCKGDDIPERPHRMARILSLPESGVEFVPRELLEEIGNWQYARSHACATAPITHYGDAPARLDLAAWIRQYCPECGEPVECGDQRKWFFKTCPWGCEHSSAQGAKDTYIGQYGHDGAFYFKCSHSHCAGRDFHQLRDVREPGWRERSTPQIAPGVDLCGILGGGQQTVPAVPSLSAMLEDVPIEERRESGDSIPMPENAYNVHGFLKDVMDLTLSCAAIPNRPLALAGALSLMSFLCARKVKTESGLCPNIYLLALAKSGTGKECPREVNKQILESVGLDAGLLENVRSGEGLEDMMQMHPALLWQSDEFYKVLRDMTNESIDNSSSLIRYLLSLYTSSNSTFATRVKVGKEAGKIVRPHLSLFATTTPNGFFDAVCERFLNDGLAARLNIMVAEEPKRGGLPGEIEVPEKIVQFATLWRDFNPPGSGNLNPKAMKVPYTASSREKSIRLLDEQFDRCERLRRDGEDSEWKASLWNRFFEETMRYALIYACSNAESPLAAVITDDAIDWAAAFCRWEIENKVHMIEKRYYRSQFERDSERIIKFMAKWHQGHGAQGMPAWKFNRLSGFLANRKAVVDNLTSQKRLVFIQEQTKGRPMALYFLPEFLEGSAGGCNKGPAKEEECNKNKK